MSGYSTSARPAVGSISIKDSDFEWGKPAEKWTRMRVQTGDGYMDWIEISVEMNPLKGVLSATVMVRGGYRIAIEPQAANCIGVTCIDARTGKAQL